MSEKISSRLQSGNSSFERLFFCPGCKNAHGFRSKEWPMPKGLSKEAIKLFQNKWSWNGDIEKPTLTPSIHIVKKIGLDKNNNPIYQTICHSFVRQGMIHFLNDCKHDLKGKTVELPNF